MARVPLSPPYRVSTPVATITGTSYTIQDRDHGIDLDFTSDSPVNVTVPAGLRAKFYCYINQSGDGAVTLQASGTTLTSAASVGLATTEQYERRKLVAWPGTDTYRLFTIGNGGGSGGGGAPVTAPVLAATLASPIPTDYPSGAVVAFAAPTNTPTAPVTWSMTSGAGLTIDSATGLVTISNTGTFYTALSGGITFTITATNAAGADTCDVTLSEAEPLPDYSTINAANRVMWFDAMYNANLELETDGQVISWTDREDAERVARNDYWGETSKLRPTYLGRSTIAPQRPALKFTPASTGSKYGLFFTDKPLSLGLRTMSITATNYNLIPELKVTYTGASTPTVAVTSPLSRPVLACVYWDDAGSAVVRINGAQVATFTMSGEFAPDYPGCFFTLYYATTPLGSSNTLIGDQQIGNGREWDTRPFVGEILEMLNFSNADAELT